MVILFRSYMLTTIGELDRNILSKNIIYLNLISMQHERIKNLRRKYKFLDFVR